MARPVPKPPHLDEVLRLAFQRARIEVISIPAHGMRADADAEPIFMAAQRLLRLHLVRAAVEVTGSKLSAVALLGAGRSTVYAHTRRRCAP